MQLSWGAGFLSAVPAVQQDERGAACWLFLVLLALNLSRWLILRSQVGFLQQHKARLALEISTLRRQAELFNNPATYVKCAKFQRLANAKEKELAALQQSAGSTSLQDRVSAGMSALKVAFIALVVVVCWGKSLLTIPPHLTWPFGRLLAFPHTNEYLATGGVAVIPWLALCDRVSQLVARVAFPQRLLLDLRTKPLTTVKEEPAGVGAADS